jgi:hypothetical protein
MTQYQKQWGGLRDFAFGNERRGSRLADFSRVRGGSPVSGR